MTFSLVNTYPYMKFHFNSISNRSTGVIVRTRKGDKVE